RLSECFANDQTIIDAIDRWLLRNEPILLREVSYFVRIGWTETGRKRLLEGLKQSFPFWAAEALLDHWGMDDTEVATALSELAMTPKAAEIGFLLPRIIPDAETCRERLMVLLRDPQCRRPDFVLSGLWQLKQAEHSGEIVEAALPFAERESIWDSNLKGILIANYHSFESVRRLAEQQLDLREANLGAVAPFINGDANLRARLIAAATPLPAILRSMIVAFLARHTASLPWSDSVLAQYDLETDAGVKAQMAIAHYRNIVRSGHGLAEGRERLSKEIIRYGPDHEARRQAAFCGLHILGALDAILTIPEVYQSGRHAHIKLSEGFRTNYPLIEFILENWTELHGVLRERFWECIRTGRETRSTTTTIVLLRSLQSTTKNGSSDSPATIQFLRARRQAFESPDQRSRLVRWRRSGSRQSELRSLIAVQSVRVDRHPTDLDAGAADCKSDISADALPQRRLLGFRRKTFLFPYCWRGSP